MRKIRLISIALLLFSVQLAHSQALTLPPSGDNQKASVSQWIGLVKATIDYSSPDVSTPSGKSRKGEIWGKLVPYGFTDLGFGYGNPSPWRAGANMNTIFTVSHDVLIEGKKLPAGTYGLHIAVGEDECTVVFSNNSSSWGSYFYKEEEDALRVTVKPAKSEYTEWLTYEFIERNPDNSVCALKWEELMIPFKIEVPNINELYLTEIRKELRSGTGFTWINWMQAAGFCLQNNINLEEALTWADAAIGAPFVGNKNFQTLQMKSRILAKLGKAEEAKTVLLEAANLATDPTQIHGLGRQLMAAGKKAEAMAMFQLNAKKFEGQWPTNVGLARGYSAEGNYKKALKYAKLAYEKAPDELNKKALEAGIEKLKKGEDMN
ncbi:DUF2911 domain-containing protein [Flammeovirgaceae bacterium SG7u.111]|nr:DUF2911 domain-containing protein [Flammeovirgaceae bacterium SG7u.132]WPO37897.1 DUF2911 domain-containing protein [Flammeovirgaceae bacterium SG7u.111]